ncbi:MAG: TetR/AcrR family transcriptional regulator [Pseudomonadota bacterium]
MSRLKYFDTPPAAEDETEGRRGRKKRATAHRIFKSAIELMQKDGYHGVSIEQICKRADVARATFFQHFANKAALMGVFTDIVRKRIETELAMETVTPIDQLRHIVDHLQRLTDEMGPVSADMLTAFIAEPGNDFRIDDPEAGIAQLIVPIIEIGQSDGTFAQHWSPNDVAISLVSSWVGVARRNTICPDPSNGGPLNRVLDLILNGLIER